MYTKNSNKRNNVKHLEKSNKIKIFLFFQEYLLNIKQKLIKKYTR